MSIVYVYGICLLAAVGAILNIISGVRIYRTGGARTIWRKVLIIIAPAAWLVFLASAAGMWWSVLHGTGKQSITCFWTNSYALLALVLLGGTKFLNPEQKRKADELVRAYKEDSDDE